ncbi:hypothetical protein DH2020_030219 [Rehmannia glutinosa]|uniref:S-protein homolog n=1 Tax=Rehmannia glutinosa TaxID=99300 RepID=A0ABR0VN42_REHGL
MIKYLLQIFVLSSIFLQTMASEKRNCLITEAFDVYVANSLPPNSPSLLVHCASKDDDLGNHTLTNNQEFHFGFCDNSFNTLFFCTLWWGKKQRGFEVFHEKFPKSWRGASCDVDVCYWAVKSDGIYFSNYNPPRGLTKKYSW